MQQQLYAVVPICDRQTAAHHFDLAQGRRAALQKGHPLPHTPSTLLVRLRSPQVRAGVRHFSKIVPLHAVAPICDRQTAAHPFDLAQGRRAALQKGHPLIIDKRGNGGSNSVAYDD